MKHLIALLVLLPLLAFSQVYTNWPPYVAPVATPFAAYWTLNATNPAAGLALLGGGTNSSGGILTSNGIGTNTTLVSAKEITTTNLSAIGTTWLNNSNMVIYGMSGASIPVMVSSNSPSGYAYSSSDLSTNFAAWKAFTGNTNSSWYNNASIANLATNWVAYKFDSDTSFDSFSSTVYVNPFNTTVTLQKSSDGTNWTDIASKLLTSGGGELGALVNWSTNFPMVTARYIRLYFLATGVSGFNYAGASSVQIHPLSGNTISNLVVLSIISTNGVAINTNSAGTNALEVLGNIDSTSMSSTYINGTTVNGSSVLVGGIPIQDYMAAYQTYNPTFLSNTVVSVTNGFGAYTNLNGSYLPAYGTNAPFARQGNYFLGYYSNTNSPWLIVVPNWLIPIPFRPGYATSFQYYGFTTNLNVPNGYNDTLAYTSDTFSGFYTNRASTVTNQPFVLVQTLYSQRIDNSTGTNVNISGLFSGQYVDLYDGAAPAWKEGRILYDTNQHTLAVYNDVSDVMLNVGSEQLVRASNKSGADIANGSVVYVSGAQGQLPTVSLAIATNEVKSGIIGIATHNITNNTIGYVTVQGVVNELNTASFMDGDALYLSTTTLGGLTTNQPAAPNYMVSVGTVLYSHSQHGKILVNIVPQWVGWNSVIGKPNVITNNQTNVTLTGSFTATGGNVVTNGQESVSFLSISVGQEPNGVASIGQEPSTVGADYITDSALNPAINVLDHYFYGQWNGLGLTNLQSTNLVGILPDARLSTNVALLNQNAVWRSNGVATASIQTNGFIMVGGGGWNGSWYVPNIYGVYTNRTGICIRPNDSVIDLIINGTLPFTLGATLDLRVALKAFSGIIPDSSGSCDVGSISAPFRTIYSVSVVTKTATSTNGFIGSLYGGTPQTNAPTLATIRAAGMNTNWGFQFWSNSIPPVLWAGYYDVNSNLVAKPIVTFP